MKKEVEQSIIDGVMITREELGQRLTADLKIVAVLVNEFLTDPQINKAITDVYWNRYLTLRDSVANAPELDLNKE